MTLVRLSVIARYRSDRAFIRCRHITETTPSSEATEPGAILADIARDERLEQAVERASMFGGRMRSLRGNQVAQQYVFQWRELFDIDAAAPEAASRLDRCVRTLLDLTVRAHLGTGANDFFIVHLVTSSFALYMILHECGDALPLAARLVAVKHYWAGFVLAYIVQNRKPIEPFVPSGEPHEWDSVLQQAQACDEEVRDFPSRVTQASCRASDTFSR